MPSSGPAAFFQHVCRVWAGYPVFGTFPGDVKTFQRDSNGFSAYQPFRYFFTKTDFRQQIQRPQTGFFAKIARALMQEVFQLLDRFRCKRRSDVMRSVGSSFQNIQTACVEFLDHIAYRLVIAAQGSRDSSCRFFTRTCQHYLTPADFKSIS